MRQRSELSCWVLTDGTIGMETQCLGLAAAIGVTPLVKRIRPNPLLRALPALARLPFVPPALGGGDPLAPPWPDLLISCGRRAAGASIALRRAGAGFTVHIQDPRAPPAWFDLLVVPAHDPARAPNVIRTTGALNRLTPARLAAAAEPFRAALAPLGRPLVAVNIGGSNRRYAFRPDRVAGFADRLRALQAAEECGLLICCSRRTDAASRTILRERLAGPRSLAWTGDGPNPYLAGLAAADAIIVTSDSVNMVCEACSTGKPVFVAAMEDETGRLRAFHDGLRRRGMTRAFEGRLASWRYPPLNDTEAAAAIVRRHLAGRGLGAAGREC